MNGLIVDCLFLLHFILNISILIYWYICFNSWSWIWCSGCRCRGCWPESCHGLRWSGHEDSVCDETVPYSITCKFIYISSSHIIIPYHPISSFHIIISYHHPVSSSLIIIPHHHFISSSHIIPYHHLVSSRIIIPYHHPASLFDSIHSKFLYTQCLMSYLPSDCRCTRRY